MENNTINYHIVVMGYNRSTHTLKVLQGLENEGVNELTLILDGTENVTDLREQDKIINKLETFSFKINLIRRETNLGLAKSIVLGVTETLQNHEAIILLEDDCVPNPGFIKYMSTMLSKYAKSQNIGSICGYMYPHINTETLKSEHFSIKRFCPWGWATWADRWEGFSLDLSSVVSKVKSLNLNISELGEDISSYCSDSHFLHNEMDIWSLNWILQQYMSNMTSIYPKFSLIDNIGFDGTGVHSTKTNAFDIEHKEKINWALECTFENDSETIIRNKTIEDEIISFLEKNSKMTYLINNN